MLVKVSLGWLRAVAPGLELDAHALSERLAERGAPVEEMAYLAEGLRDVIVARVEAVERHPDADRLSVCTVNAGGESTLTVVCGAPNVTAGKIYPFAPVGSTLPGGVSIGKRKVRGVVSNGMLCSARELGLGHDHAGIMELSEGPQLGQSFVDALALDDWRLDIEVTANRGDMLSHRGIARELAPGGESALVLPQVPGGGAVSIELVTDAPEAEADGVTVRIEDSGLCRRYLGAVIRGVRVGPSPA